MNSFNDFSMRVLLLSGLLIIGGCNPEVQKKTNVPAESEESMIPSWEDSPWPSIRKKRINQLLPSALKAAEVDAWMLICRENNNDPLADHVGGQNAGGEAAFLFYNDQEGFHSVVFSPEGEATSLADLAIHDTVVPVKRGMSAIQQASDYMATKNIQKLALNTSTSNNVADGLSHSQYVRLTEALPKGIALLPSTEVVYHWMSIKLPEEVDIMRKAAQLASDWQYEAYQQIVPGQSTDADIAKFLKNKMKEYGVKDGWAPDQNPNVNSGPDRGHSHATDKVIQGGDVIQIDFGVKLYDRWVSDIQRFAYVLREGEDKAPDSVLAYWEAGKAGSRAAYAAMKPGVKGVDVDRAQREVMEARGSAYVMWSTGHPVGYVAHDVGPNLGGSQASHVRPAAQKELKEGMTFAFDGFFSWPLSEEEYKTISVEEMVVITESGAEFLISPQQDLILVD